METTVVAPGLRDVELLRAMAHRIDQQDPGAFNNLGVLYYSKGLYAESVEAFLHALKLDPRMRTAARNLEIAALQTGACDARLADLTARLAADADDTTAQRERARLLRLIGRQTEAVQQLDTLIANDPEDGLALFERGLIEQRAGDLRRAQRWFERAVNAANGDPITRLHLAEVLYQRGHNEQALATLELLLTECPSIAEAHLLHGFVLGDMGHHDAALVAAQRAAQLNPALQTLQADLSLDASAGYVTPSNGSAADDSLARYGLGMAFRQRGYFDEARREFERALAMGENASLARHAIAELDLVGGHFAAARAGFEQLLAEQSDSARFWNEHGVALHQSGDLDGAADSYRRALRLDPRYALAYNNLGVALSDLGEASPAREALKRAVDLEPTMARAQLNLARWFVRHRDPLAALTLLRELIAFQPTNADCWYALGTVLLALHRPEDARAAFSSAIDHRPDHAEARYSLAEMLGALGDEDGALRETQQALGLSPMRVDARLTVGIDLQHECPEAAGALDLLAIRAEDPLAGVSLGESDVAAMLAASASSQQSVAGTTHSSHQARSHLVPSVASPVQSAETLTSWCEEADAFAARGALGEALDRYARCVTALERSALPEPDLRRRVVIGVARAQCLLGDGHLAVTSLRVLSKEFPNDTEVVALFAASAAAAAVRGEVRLEVAPILMRRLLRMEAPSAALLHFVGDAAVSIADESLALALYRRALTADPSRPSPRVAIARLLRLRGDFQSARLELFAALAVVPRLRDATLELVRIGLATRSFRSVLAPLTRHCATTPTDIEALVLLVELLVCLERDADARVTIDRVLRHDADNPAALWFDGILLVRQSRVRDAASRWRRIAGRSVYQDRAREALARLASDSSECSFANDNRVEEDAHEFAGAKSTAKIVTKDAPAELFPELSGSYPRQPVAP